MEHGWQYIVLLMVGVALGYFGTVHFTTPTTITETITETVMDTQYVELPADTVYQTTPVQVVEHDTMYVTQQETIYVEQGQEYAQLDTSFNAGRLRVQYYLPPLSFWDVRWHPRPQLMQTVTTNTTETITANPPWYLRKETWGFAGLITGVLLSR